MTNDGVAELSYFEVGRGQIWFVHAVTRHLAWQLLKAATSVGANLEEADGGQTRRDFIAKVAIAKKESKEAVYWLRVIAATDGHVVHRVPSLLDEAKQIAAIVSTIHKTAEDNLKKTTARLAVLLLIVGCAFYVWL